MRTYEDIESQEAAKIAQAARNYRDRQAILRIYWQRAATRREITADMAVYDHNHYAIKIVEELQGFFTCEILIRETNSILLTVRFEKIGGKGVVYEIRDSTRMNFLAFSPRTLSVIEVISPTGSSP